MGKSNDGEYEFKWVQADKIKDEVFYPIFVKNRITNLPKHIEKFVEVDNIN